MPEKARGFLETLVLRKSAGLSSRFRVALYRAMGMRIGQKCRLESIRIRRAAQIEIGNSNALTRGCWLWPEDSGHDGIRIRIGDTNYFNRDVMIDACNYVEIGNKNMFGPGVYITDSNHTVPADGWVGSAPMDRGTVSIGNGCWIGARAVILKNVTLGDRCVVGAGAVVTKSFPAGSVLAGVPARLLRRSSQAG
jgi:acetyltransferase-like isoleucine patch superfamily enzyme